MCRLPLTCFWPHNTWEWQVRQVICADGLTLVKWEVFR
jgi:hypothetical protein